jgi:hypothetical protein
MDGVCRPLGCPATIRFGGRLGLVRPLTLWKIGVCEQHILGRRRTPLHAARDTLAMLDPPEGVARGIIDGAVAEMRDPANRADRYVTVAQFQDWLGEPEGLWFTGWLCLRRSFREFRTPERSRKQFSAAERGWLRDFADARDRASGTDLLSNAEWSGSGEGRDRFMPWKRVLRFAASEYGFTKEDVGRWTLWDLQLYTCEEDKLGGTKRVDGEAARALAGRAVGRRVRR